MFKNYLLIAWRHLQKSQVYAFINILGLATGMAATILILLFVQFELSFDSFHEKSDRTYRISRQWFDADGTTSLHLGAVAPPVGPLLKNDYGEEIEAITRLMPASNLLLARDEETAFVEENIIFTEPDFFNIFSFDLLQGNPETALTGPGKVVLSESTARKFFQSPLDALGQRLTIDNQADLEVTGVLADAPKNSHIHYDILVSFDTWVAYIGGPASIENNWSWNSYYTYVTLNEGVSQARMQSLMPAFLDNHLAQFFKPENLPADMQDLKPSETTALTLWPIEDIHLYSNLDSELEPNSDISLVYTYSAVAILILFIACINFMNLSTARAAKREREVGLRKVFGALKKLLVRQFLIEAMVMSVIALVLAVLLVELALPYFNNMVNRELSVGYTENVSYYLQLLGIALGVGLLAGSYPAFFLSRFQPAAILRGTAGGSAKNRSWLRSSLVVGQFTIATILIICMGVVYLQLDFLQNKDLKFSDEGVLLINSIPINQENYEQIRTDLLRDPSINNVAMSTLAPSQRLLDSQGATIDKDGEPYPLPFRLANIDVDFGFLAVYGIPLSAGRSFNSELATDSTEAFIVNEATAEAMDMTPEELIDMPFQYDNVDGRIVGVVGDFHFENAKYPIAPVIFRINTNRGGNLSVRVSPGQEQEAMAWLQERQAYYNPGYPLEAEWISDNFDQQYADEDRLGKVYGFFSLLAIIIGALGLFGLALHTTQARIREIGVRKVLGASSWQVVQLLSTTFSKLVMISFFVGAPLAYIFMNYWLSEFPYRISIPWYLFAFAGFMVFFIALATVSAQSFRAASSNPTQSLRSE